MAYKKMSPEERAKKLAALRASMESADKASTYGGNNFLYLEPDSTTYVRILPAVGDMDEFTPFQQRGLHRVGDEKITCLRFTAGMDCPICELADLLSNGDASEKAMAKKISSQNKFWFNVIRRKNKAENNGDRDRWDTFVGPLILSAGQTIFDGFLAKLNDPDFEEYPIDDPYYGFDLKIRREGSDWKSTKYYVEQRPGQLPQPLIVGDDGKFSEELTNQILDGARDLYPVMMPEDPKDDEEFIKEFGHNPMVKIYSYKRTVAQFGIDPSVNVDDLEDLIESSNSSKDDDSSSGRGSYNGRSSRNEDDDEDEPVAKATNKSNSAVEDRLREIRAKRERK